MIKKLKGGDFTNPNSFNTSVSSNSLSSNSNNANSKGISSTTKYLIIGGLVLLLILVIGIAIYFYKKHSTDPTEAPTTSPTTLPTSSPTTNPSLNLGPYHPSKLLDDNKNNQVVAIIKGQLKDFGNSYNRLEKDEKRKFKRCFKNPLNTNCSF
jgi:hypothetical protein